MVDMDEEIKEKFEKYAEEANKVIEKIRVTLAKTYTEMVKNLVKDHLFKDKKQVDIDVLIMFIDEIAFTFITEILNLHYQLRNKLAEHALKNLLKDEGY